MWVSDAAAQSLYVIQTLYISVCVCVCVYIFLPMLGAYAKLRKATISYLMCLSTYLSVRFNPFTPNDHYSGRTAPLTSKRFILYIYSTNTGTEYFKHGIYSHFFLFKTLFVS